MMNDVRIDMYKLHPNLRYKLNKLLKLCDKSGIGIIITEGFRTKGYQNMLYAKGRTEKGNIVTNAKGSSYSSQHQWGIAFDIAINDKKNTYNVRMIGKVAQLAKKCNLCWGGDWKSFQDNPHFYLGKWGSDTRKLKEQYVAPDTFMKTWTAKTKKKLPLYKTITKVGKVTTIPAGSRVYILYKKAWYAKVEYDGKIGYINKKWLV